MTRISWWLVEQLSRMLEPDERDAVRGDLAEIGVTSRQALCDLAGLVVRRKAAIWKDWRPWLALFGLVVLVGVPLGRHSLLLSEEVAQDLWIYWHFGVRYLDGLTVSQDIVMFVCQSSALILYSWIAGFVLGSLSRRTIWVNGALFCFIWLFAGGVRGASLLVTLGRKMMLTFTGPEMFRGLPGIVYAGIFFSAYTVIFFLPLVRGVYQGLQLHTLRTRPTVLLAAAIAIMTALATWTGGWERTALETWSEGAIPVRIFWQARLASLSIVSWPISYILATAISRRWPSRSVPG